MRAQGSEARRGPSTPTAATGADPGSTDRGSWRKATHPAVERAELSGPVLRRGPAPGAPAVPSSPRAADAADPTESTSASTPAREGCSVMRGRSGGDPWDVFVMADDDLRDAVEVGDVRGKAVRPDEQIGVADLADRSGDGRRSARSRPGRHRTPRRAPRRLSPPPPSRAWTAGGGGSALRQQAPRKRPYGAHVEAGREHQARLGGEDLQYDTGCPATDVAAPARQVRGRAGCPGRSARRPSAIRATGMRAASPGNARRGGRLGAARGTRRQPRPSSTCRRTPRRPGRCKAARRSSPEEVEPHDAGPSPFRAACGRRGRRSRAEGWPGGDRREAAVESHSSRRRDDVVTLTCGAVATRSATAEAKSSSSPSPMVGPTSTRIRSTARCGSGLRP